MVDKVVHFAKKPVIQRFVVYFSSGGIAKAIPFLVLTVIATILSPEDFGLISNFNVVVSFSAALISVRMVKFLEADYYKRDREGNSILVSNLTYIMLGITLFLVLVAWVGRAYFSDWLKLEYSWILLGILVGAAKCFGDVRSSMLRLMEKARAFAGFQMIEVFLAAGLTLLLIVVLGMNWEGRVWATVATGGVILLISVAFLHRAFQFPARIDKKLMGSLFAFGLPLVPYSLSPFLKHGIDKILITNAAGLADNGIFSLAYTFASVFDMIAVAFFSAYTPMIYKTLSREERPSFSLKVRLVKEGYLTLAGMAVLLFVGYFVIRFAVFWLLDEAYWKGLTILPWLLVHILLKTIFVLFSVYLMYSKKTTRMGLSIFLIAVAHACLSFLLIPKLGMHGAVISILVSDILRIFTIGYLSQKYFPMPWLGVPFWK